MDVLNKKQVQILANAKIGKGCKIKHSSTVHQHSIIGSWSTLVPACRVLGKVKVGERAFIGATASILPICKIGKDVTAGACACAVVINKIPDGDTVSGVHAISMKRMSK